MADATIVSGTEERVLQAYLLGRVDYDEMLRFQRRLVFDVSGDRSKSYVLLCEHYPLISVGREGSREHIGFEPTELVAREWPVRWVNRGGGCLFHAPGQLAVYCILPLNRFGLNLKSYLDHLHAALIGVLSKLEVPAQRRAGQGGVWANGRLIAHVGVAVRDWVAYFGAAINVHPDLEPFRRVKCAGPGEPPMTSIARERREAARDATVRQRLIEAFEHQFGFNRTTLFHQHPALTRPAPTDAVATRTG